MRFAKLVILFVALAMVAPTAVAYHRSVGGDIHTQFPPAEETDGPDVTGDYDVDWDKSLVDGRMVYVNTLDSSLSATFDRVSPPDQVINHPDIGYFDVVDMQYAGAFQLSDSDPFDGQHDITYSPNIHYQLPDMSTVPGLGGPNSGTIYPTLTYFYAYLFGNGNAQDGAGADLTADHASFDGLIDASACDGTDRCQLFNPGDLQAVTSGGEVSAICGWVPEFHWHPGASVADCRDFDFGYVSDNVDDLGGQNQPESPTWVWAGVPGWVGNIGLIQPVSMAAAAGESFVNPFTKGIVQFLPQANPFWETITVHWTVGHTLDPSIEAAGGINADGDGTLACLEPGFDVNGGFLAHDLDLYDTYEANSAVVLAELEAQAATAVGEVAGMLGLEPVVDSVFDVVGQGTDAAFEPRAESEAYYAEDNSGAISVTTGSGFDCLDADGEHDEYMGKVETSTGETVVNQVGIRVWQDATGLPSFRDPLETFLNPGDAHENPGVNPILYFDGLLRQNSDTKTDLDLYDGFYDTQAVADATGVSCGTFGDFGNTCMGDEMLGLGYRDPTSLVFVFRGSGPINFVDWDDLGVGAADYVWAEYADLDEHCVIGASPKVFSGGGQTLAKRQVFEVILGESLDGLTQGQIHSKLQADLCGDAATLDYFPGTGFSQHEQGGSLGNPFGWQWLPAVGGASTGVIDVYYVVSIDQNQGLEGDRLGLDGLTVGDPTVVNTDDGSVTMVWRDHVELGTQGTGL